MELSTERTPLCDLCGHMNPAWLWMTPNPPTQEAYFEDEGWYVCDECHQLIIEDKPDVLLQRALLNIPMIAEIAFEDPMFQEAMRQGQRDEVTRMHGLFWQYKDNDTYEKLED